MITSVWMVTTTLYIISVKDSVDYIEPFKERPFSMCYKFLPNHSKMLGYLRE